MAHLQAGEFAECRVGVAQLKASLKENELRLGARANARGGHFFTQLCNGRELLELHARSHHLEIGPAATINPLQTRYSPLAVLATVSAVSTDLAPTSHEQVMVRY